MNIKEVYNTVCARLQARLKIDEETAWDYIDDVPMYVFLGVRGENSMNAVENLERACIERYNHRLKVLNDERV